MRKLVVFLFFLAVAGIVAYTYQTQIINFLYYSPCDTPITYKIGEIDQGFNVTTQQFKSDIQEATTIWNDVEGKQLFAYNPAKATLTVNLIFDERQGLTNQINNLDGQLKNEKNSITPQMQAYQNEVHDFQTKLADLNAQIAYWNSKGGAPKNVYDQLTSQQNALKQEAAQLNQMAQSLNRATDSYNAQVSQLNQTVNSLDTVAQTKPEEGVYDPNNDSVSIYYNHGQNELIHTLAHELGHALGMKHVSDPNAIMYYQTNSSTTPAQQDISQLEQICRKQTLLDRAQAWFEQVKQALSSVYSK